jgi:hypothetical protein
MAAHTMSYLQASIDRLNSAYRDAPPWDIGQPQPALLSLLDEYPPAGPVLDVGCAH